MTLASANDLITYFADLVEELERYAVTLLPPNDSDEIELGDAGDGGLIIDLAGRLPVSPQSKNVDLELFERWRQVEAAWVCVEYKYELRHYELAYRRAFHRHHEEDFARLRGVATHEHCEATMSIKVCGHYAGHPVVGAFDGFRRLYECWLLDTKPDCRALACLD